MTTRLYAPTRSRARTQAHTHTHTHTHTHSRTRAHTHARTHLANRGLGGVGRCSWLPQVECCARKPVSTRVNSDHLPVLNDVSVGHPSGRCEAVRLRGVHMRDVTRSSLRCAETRTKASAVCIMERALDDSKGKVGIGWDFHHTHATRIDGVGTHANRTALLTRITRDDFNARGYPTRQVIAWALTG